MDKILVLIIVFGFLALIAILPTLFLMIIAKRLGAKISLKEALFMKSRKTLTKETIKAIALVQKNKLSISTNMLEAQMLAGGNPLDCIQGLLYAKGKNVNTDFQQICYAVLAEKDLKETIDFAAKQFEVDFKANGIRDTKLRNLEINYYARFSLTFGTACFNPPDKEKIENEILPRIKIFLEKNDNTNLINSSKIITETIIDTKYWETKGLNLIEQDLTINRT